MFKLLSAAGSEAKLDLEHLLSKDPALALRLRQARDEFLKAQSSLADSGHHPVESLIRASQSAWTQLARYPDGTAEDWLSGQSWYYHAHSDPSDAPGLGQRQEHGHFHCFVDSIKVKQDAVPIAVPKRRHSRSDCVTHLVALSIGMNGLPIRVFALSRRASDEMMFPSDVVMSHVRSFWKEMTLSHVLVGRWLGAVLRLFEPEIAALLRQRDEAQQRLNGHWIKSRLELLQPEVLVEVPIDLRERLELLDRLVPTSLD